MADVNMTRVYLLNVPLENDYRHTLYFPRTDAGKQAQYNYFYGRRVSGCEFTDFSYQRKDHCIRVPLHYDTLVSKGVNYVMYQNKAYTDKWFYAFITHMEYKDDGRTDIYIETDCMQTWYFDITVQPSYIEREHCKDDTPGINTQPEDLETGEYVTNQVWKNDDLTVCSTIISSTVDGFGTKYINKADAEVYPSSIGYKYGGVFSGAKYFLMNETGTQIADNFLRNLADTGQSDAVVSIFMFPTALLNIKNGVITSDNAGKSIYWGDSDTDSKKIKRATTICGYEPNNKKLLTYPYTYLMVSNNAGGESIYHYELFEYLNNEIEKQYCTFQINGVLCSGGSIRLFPLNYCGEDENYLRGLTGAKYPVGSWANDVYTNWITQQSMNLSIATQRGELSAKSGDLARQSAVISGIGNTVSGVVQGATQGAAIGSAAGGYGAIAGGIVGGVVGGGMSAANSYINYQQADIQYRNGLLDIKSVAAQKYSHSMTPPQAMGTVNAGDVGFASNLCTFTAHAMSIKREYAEVIDRYFDMYGYATNLVKLPNENHREYYWFTKTIAANIDGNIPNDDLNIIKRCYNNGITFWRYYTSVGDYPVNNPIV